MRMFLFFLLLIFFNACNSGTGRQEIDLTDQTSDNPVDGVGHYVYALSLPQSIKAGNTLEIQMDWRTIGPADVRKRYDMEVRLTGPTSKLFQVDNYLNTVGEANLINWINYYFPLPADFPTGTYHVEVRLLDETREDGIVPLAFREEMAAGDGFYQVATVMVE